MENGYIYTHIYLLFLHIYTHTIYIYVGEWIDMQSREMNGHEDLINVNVDGLMGAPSC